MLDTMTRHLSAISDLLVRNAIRHAIEATLDRMSSQPLTTAGLLVSGTGSGVTAKIGSSDFYASVAGALVKVAASTDMPALVGTITATKYNVFCFFVDGSGTLTSAMGVEGAAIGSVKFPNFPKNNTLIGFILVTYASTFTGGTTPLATATTLYFSPIGAFDPTVLI